MKKSIKQLLAGNALMLASLSASAVVIVDGNFGDWQVDSNTMQSGLSDVHQTVEDQHGGYLSPGYGGQQYDAEAMYTRWDNSRLYIGVMTGRAQNASGWTAGDIAIDLGSNGSYEFGVVTSSQTGFGGDGIGNAGALYAVNDWNYGIWEAPNQSVGLNAQGAVDYGHPTSVAQGALIDMVDFAYSDDETGLGQWDDDRHYFIETAIDVSLLGGLSSLLSDGFSLHWAANCNNDFIQLDIDPAAVPEPGTFGMLLAGSLALFFARRRESNKDESIIA